MLKWQKSDSFPQVMADIPILKKNKKQTKKNQEKSIVNLSEFLTCPRIFQNESPKTQEKLCFYA